MQQSWRTSIYCTTSWGSQRRSTDVWRQPVGGFRWRTWGMEQLKRTIHFHSCSTHWMEICAKIVDEVCMWKFVRSHEKPPRAAQRLLVSQAFTLGIFWVSLCLPEPIQEQNPPFPMIIGLLIYSRSKLLMSWLGFWVVFFNVSDDGENAMMVSWMIIPANWRPHRDDMGWFNPQVGRTYCPLAAAYGRATQQFGGCTAHQGGASGSQYGLNMQLILCTLMTNLPAFWFHILYPSRMRKLGQ